MTYVVTESCIKCKYTDCVEVCPVDCFYEGPEFLVIHPDECIDCGLCEPECPIEAIYADDELPSDQIEFIEINLKLSEVYENITEAKEPLPEAEKYKNIKNKKRVFIESYLFQLQKSIHQKILKLLSQISHIPYLLILALRLVQLTFPLQKEIKY